MTKNICCSFCNKDRKEVSQMIEGPQTKDVSLYICDECVDYTYEVIHTKPMDGSTEVTRTPEEIKAHLDNFIVGQDDAKIAISVAIYNHYKRINNPDVGTDIDKSNLLLIGSSGTGKTLLVKTIAKMFDLPCVIADATTLTEAGYVGEDVDNVVSLLMQNANGDLEKAQCGIIFIDEIDKKSRKSESSTVSRDVSGEGVQQALLKLIEGTIVHLSDPYKSESIEFDTKNVLFVCSGAFVGLEEIISKNRKTSSIGIHAELKNKNDTTRVMKQLNSEDLISYGLIPEFVGRCPVTVVFDDLDVDMLVRILKEPKNSLVEQFTALFKMDGAELEFDDKYLRFVAEECLKQKIGARGLRSVIEKTLQTVQYQLPRLTKEGIVKIIVESEGMVRYVSKPKRKQRANTKENIA